LALQVHDIIVRGGYKILHKWPTFDIFFTNDIKMNFHLLLA